jgi:large subunit ribosomal protein L7/L12
MSDAVAELDKELEDLAGKLDKLTLIQASQLVKYLEKHWGVSAAAPMAMAAAPAGGGGGAAAAVEKTTFSVILENSGDKKIQVIKEVVIKEVRAITGLGLKEAKDLVDGAPKPIKEGVTKEEAADIKAKVEAAGGKVKVD